MRASSSPARASGQARFLPAPVGSTSNRPDVQGGGAVVPLSPATHATGFPPSPVCPIPNCILARGGRCFLGEVADRRSNEKPARQPEIPPIPLCPHLKIEQTRFILCQPRPTITFGPEPPGKKPYWNSEIIDAYCKILIPRSAALARSATFSTPWTDKGVARSEEAARLRRHFRFPTPSPTAVEDCDLWRDRTHLWPWLMKGGGRNGLAQWRS